MKKAYKAPEIEIVKVTLTDVLYNSPTEGEIPGGGGHFDPDNPGGIDEL